MNLEKAVHHEGHKEKRGGVGIRRFTRWVSRCHDETHLIFFVSFVVKMRFSG